MRIVTCEGPCNRHFHIKCAKLPPYFADILVSHPANISYRCDDCKSKGSSLSDVIRILSTQQKIITNLCYKVDPLDSAIVSQRTEIRNLSEKIEALTSTMIENDEARSDCSDDVIDDEEVANLNLSLDPHGNASLVDKPTGDSQVIVTAQEPQTIETVTIPTVRDQQSQTTSNVIMNKPSDSRRQSSNSNSQNSSSGRNTGQTGNGTRSHSRFRQPRQRTIPNGNQSRNRSRPNKSRSNQGRNGRRSATGNRSRHFGSQNRQNRVSNQQQGNSNGHYGTNQQQEISNNFHGNHNVSQVNGNGLVQNHIPMMMNQPSQGMTFYQPYVHQNFPPLRQFSPQFQQMGPLMQYGF